MAHGNRRNSAGVNSKGSGKAWYRPCDSAGTPSGTTWYTLGIVKESTFTDQSTTNEREDEGGNKYFSAGARTVSLEMVSLQRDQGFLSIYDDLRGGYCQVLKEQASETVAGKYEYVVMGIAQLEDNKVVKLPGGEPTLKFNGVINTSTLAVDLTGVTGAAVAGASLGSPSIAANAYYKEVAV